MCKQIVIDDAIRDAEVEGGITKIREQLNLNDGKMYMESNPDSALDLDPMESSWGMNNSYHPDDGLVGPLE